MFFKDTQGTLIMTVVTNDVVRGFYHFESKITNVFHGERALDHMKENDSLFVNYEGSREKRSRRSFESWSQSQLNVFDWRKL